MKLKHRIFIGGLVASLIIVIMPFDDFYAPPDSHYGWVAECRAAHEAGYSWSLGSGFWYEPEDWHIEAPQIWHPTEDPETIPHGSILAMTEGEAPLLLAGDFKILLVIALWIVLALYYFFLAREEKQ